VSGGGIVDAGLFGVGLALSVVVVVTTSTAACRHAIHAIDLVLRCFASRLGVGHPVWGGSIMRDARKTGSERTIEGGWAIATMTQKG
jgi:hypothetical protein